MLKLIVTSRPFAHRKTLRHTLPTRAQTAVRITLVGLIVPDEAVASPSVLPDIFFGATPSTSVSVLVSDIDATIVSARVPPASSVGVVPIFVSGESGANASFSYSSPDASIACASPICEVDALSGGALTVRVAGLGSLTTYAPAVNVYVNDMIPATAVLVSVSVTKVGAQSPADASSSSYDVTIRVPATVPDAPLPNGPVTRAYMSISTLAGTAYADFTYRSPPRATAAYFSPDGSRIDVVFDQPTSSASTSVGCQNVTETPTNGSTTLGEGAMCFFDSNGQTLILALGRGASIDVGHALVLLPAIFRSSNGVSAWNSRQVINVTAPLVGLPPRSVMALLLVSGDFRPVFFVFCA